MIYYQTLVSLFVFFSTVSLAHRDDATLYFARAQTKNKYDRSRIADLGIAVDGVFSDSVTFIVTKEEIEKLKEAQIPLEISELPERMRDFPSVDKEFHNYEETVKALDEIAIKYPNLAERFSIGKSLEGRKLEGIRLSSDKKLDSLPTSIFTGCHHAREHLSVEVPLKLAQYLAANYATNSRIKTLLDTREVWIIPMVNPDGAEYDISSGSYKYWRKNRRDNGDGTYVMPSP